MINNIDDEQISRDPATSDKKKSAAELLFPDGKLPVCHHSATPSFLPPPRKRTLPLSYVRARLDSQSDGETSDAESPSSSLNMGDPVSSQDEAAAYSEIDPIYQQINFVSSLYSSLNDENSSIYDGFNDAASIGESIPQHGPTWNSTSSSLKNGEPAKTCGKKPEVPPKTLETFRSIAASRQKLHRPNASGINLVHYDSIRRNSSGSDDSSESGKSSSSKTSGIPRSNTSPSVKQRSSSSSNPPTPPPKPRSVSVGEIKPQHVMRNGSRKSISSSSSSSSSSQSSPPPRSAAKQSTLESPWRPRTMHRPPLPPSIHQV